MKLILTLFLVVNTSFLFSQTIDEKHLYTLSEYPGDVDAYSLAYDKNTGNYAYVYYIPDENKAFILANNSLSDKYDGISSTDIKFDSEGNYYAVATNYKEDYGIDNVFLISNGKIIKSYESIEGYSAFVNNTDEYVFIFKEFGQYKIGYYNPISGFRESGSYDNLKPMYKNVLPEEPVGEDGFFFKNAQGQRGFVGINNGKAYFIFGSDVTPTDYSDIAEYSFDINKNGELVYIARSKGSFYESNGNTFLVVGSKQYPSFDYVNSPIYFMPSGAPVYTVTDSINKNLYTTELYVGDEPQSAYLDLSKSKPAPAFSGGIYDISISPSGELSYMASEVLTNPSEEDYVYNSKNYYVRNGTAYDFGYNTGMMKSSNGKILYGAKESTETELYQLYMFDGYASKKLNDKNFDAYTDYGFTPDGKVYYIGENFRYDAEKIYKGSKYNLYIDGKLISQPDMISFQSMNYNEGEPATALQFDSRGNYTYVTEKIIDTVSYTSAATVWTNNKALPFRSSISAPNNAFNYITNLSYTPNDKLFFIGNIYDTLSRVTSSDLLVDNNSLGKIYNTISDIKYDKTTNTLTFRGARGREIYDVVVRF